MIISATDRLARLVAAIPWIVAQDGVSVDEVAERFDYPRSVLLDDLQNVVYFVGVPPYTPDTLIEVHIDNDMVWIDYADWFARPMRLTGAEVLALLTAGETVLAFDTQDEAGPLATGLAKLRLASGLDSEALDVQLGVAAESVLRGLRSALDAGVCVDIDYYSFGRDELTERRIEPSRFFSEDGSWYVAAYCHLAEGERVFRLDRIQQLTITDVAVEHVDRLDGGEGPFSIAEAPRATIAFPSPRVHLFDHLPYDSLSALDDDTMEVVLPVSSARWLERLMIRLGPEAELVEHGVVSDSVDVAAAARRVLARY